MPHTRHDSSDQDEPLAKSHVERLHQHLVGPLHYQVIDGDPSLTGLDLLHGQLHAETAMGAVTHEVRGSHDVPARCETCNGPAPR